MCSLFKDEDVSPSHQKNINNFPNIYLMKTFILPLSKNLDDPLTIWHVLVLGTPNVGNESKRNVKLLVSWFNAY